MTAPMNYADALVRFLKSEGAGEPIALGGGIPTELNDFVAGAYAAMNHDDELINNAEVFVKIPGRDGAMLYPVVMRRDADGDLIIHAVSADTAQFGHTDDFEVGDKTTDQTLALKAAAYDRIATTLGAAREWEKATDFLEDIGETIDSVQGTIGEPEVSAAFDHAALTYWRALADRNGIIYAEDQE